MISTHTRFPRTLGIASSTRGFGYALVEGERTLADWGFKRILGAKNTTCMDRIREIVARYNPKLVVLQNFETKTARRPPRLKRLNRQIAAFASEVGSAVRQFSREEINRAFFPEGGGTKYKVAQTLAAEFSNELSASLPPKRKLWMSEDYRMDLFNAVALALTTRVRRKQHKGPKENVG